MKDIISKELLSEVLGINIFKVLNEHDNYLVFGSNSKTKYSIRGEAYCHINIYELAHKCKEWADKKSYSLKSYVFRNNGYCYFDDSQFICDTEYQAIFKACQFILDNKDKS